MSFTHASGKRKVSFEPNMRIATPKNYQIGPDDELDIQIFGDVLDNFKVIDVGEWIAKRLTFIPDLGLTHGDHIPKTGAAEMLDRSLEQEL